MPQHGRNISPRLTFYFPLLSSPNKPNPNPRRRGEMSDVGCSSWPMSSQVKHLPFISHPTLVPSEQLQPAQRHFWKGPRGGSGHSKLHVVIIIRRCVGVKGSGRGGCRRRGTNGEDRAESVRGDGKEREWRVGWLLGRKRPKVQKGNQTMGAGERTRVKRERQSRRGGG